MKKPKAQNMWPAPPPPTGLIRKDLFQEGNRSLLTLASREWSVVEEKAPSRDLVTGSALCPTVLGLPSKYVTVRWSCSASTTWKLPVSFEISGPCVLPSPFSFGQNDVHTQFYLTVFGMFMLMGIPCVRVLKFDFLLLFCYILFELPAQLKELRRCEEKYFLKYFIYLF